MSFPPDPFQRITEFAEILGLEDLMEGRFENDGDGNPIYIAFSPYPNADPAEPVWFIRKVYYVVGNAVRMQLPDRGIEFTYIWNDRASYFS